MLKMHKSKLIILLFLILLLGAITASLLYCRVMSFNKFYLANYPIRGVDVSSFQGKIDWDVLASQDIDFAYIKATEGSKYVDKYFTNNYSQAQKTNLRVGAYHFFSFDSYGITQAQNFISTVPKIKNMLPPVVDVEFYGNKEKHPPDKASVTKNLSTLLFKIEEFYGTKPVIYVTRKSYNAFIINKFDKYDIWFRDVYFKPTLPNNKDWTFWQYTDREQLRGYSGKEKYIDLNVFSGSKNEFKSYQ